LVDEARSDGLDESRFSAVFVADDNDFELLEDIEELVLQFRGCNINRSLLFLQHINSKGEEGMSENEEKEKKRKSKKKTNFVFESGIGTRLKEKLCNILEPFLANPVKRSATLHHKNEWVSEK
jgi:hypothetical protein